MSCKKCGYEVKACSTCGAIISDRDDGSTTTNISTKDKKEFRLLMFGQRGSGVSSAANYILGENLFETGFAFEPITMHSKMESRERFGCIIKVVDTPGFKLETNLSDQMKTFEHIQRSIDLLAPGPHVLILVMPIDRYTEEGKFMVTCLHSFKELTPYIIVVFTQIDVIKNDIYSMKSKISSSESLHELLALSGGNFELLGNTTNDDKQVGNLIKMIEQIVEKNSEHYFDKRIFSQEAESKLYEIVKERNDKWNKLQQATSKGLKNN